MGKIPQIMNLSLNPSMPTNIDTIITFTTLLYLTRSETSFKSPPVESHQGSYSEIRRTNSSVQGEGNEEEWSTDLTKIDEEFEKSLTHPSLSKATFIRLLIRAVGLLNSEDDVERLLLEDESFGFFQVIKSIRGKVTSALNGTPTPDTLLISADNDAAKNFTHYAMLLLDKGVSTLKRLLHVLRLLNISRAKVEKEKVGKEVDLSLKRATGVAVLGIWNDVELKIYHELQSHFADKSVEDIPTSYVPSRGQPSNRIKKGNVEYDDEDREDLVYVEELPPLFTPSAQLAAVVYKYVVHFSERAYALLSEDISFELLVESDAQGNSTQVCTTVLRSIKKFLENEYASLLIITI